MKFLKGCLIIFGGLFALLIIAAIISVANQTPEERAEAERLVNEVNATNEAEKAKPIAKQEETKGLTGPQKNAVRSAKNYLAMTGFSRDGLIEQLSSAAGEGYKIEDATIAVDSLTVDWNEQAGRSAKNYLDMTGFSCKGLIEQLSSNSGEKYTVQQATFGAKQAGACE